MTTQLSITISYGSSSVNDEDKERAESAALAVFEAFEWRAGEPIAIDPVEAQAAFRRHISEEDYFRSPRDTILIAAWEAAESAANRALTAGWHNPNGGACKISA